MTQNETHEIAALATGLAGLLSRRKALGVRRLAAPPPPPATPQTMPTGHGESAPAPRPNESPATERPTAPSTQPTAIPRPGKRPQHAQGAQGAQGAPDTSGFSTLEDLARAASSCQACTLSRNRNRVFVSAGTGSSGVLFLDEAPDPATDSTGDPFRSPAGELLASIITKGMGLQLDDVQVACLVKCQPPANRPPDAAELGTCRSWLDRQIELSRPKVIITLGRPAAAALLGIDAPLGRLRGQVHALGGRKVIATYHPDYLLRSPQDKKKTWEDIQLAMDAAGIPIPGRS